MASTLSSLDTVCHLIDQGEKLLLAGDESSLSTLPAGDWIGGTTPYFMTARNEQQPRETIHVSTLPQFIEAIEIRFYDETTIDSIYTDAPANGVSFLIIPATSPTHYAFALNAPKFENFAVRPLAGWIAGIALEETGLRHPMVYNGMTREASERKAVVMHITLPDHQVADIGIINMFCQGAGDVIVFPGDGFSADFAYINGELRNFRDYIIENDIDTRLPLVADHYGVSINTSMREIGRQQDKVEFYAPVFSHLNYKHARPVTNYNSKLKAQLPIGLKQQMVFACSCILNQRYPGQKIELPPVMTGPVSYGEIAYLLLNQTMVYVRIIDVPRSVYEQPFHLTI